LLEETCHVRQDEDGMARPLLQDISLLKLSTDTLSRSWFGLSRKGRATGSHNKPAPRILLGKVLEFTTSNMFNSNFHTKFK